jgi:hypothetical protein
MEYGNEQALLCEIKTLKKTTLIKGTTLNLKASKVV